MKITLNLAPAESLRNRVALVWALPLTIVCLAFLIVLGRALMREFRHYHSIETQLAEVRPKPRTCTTRKRPFAGGWMTLPPTTCCSGPTL